MGHAENKLKWCKDKAKKEGVKHRGLREIAPDGTLAKEHLAKADHNLKTMIYLIKGGITDWAVNASFYARYHCPLAVLAKNGYESRNQEYTFAAIETLIDSGKLTLSKELLEKISSNEEELGESSLVELREEFQYGIGKILEEPKMKAILEDTKEFIGLVKSALE